MMLVSAQDCGCKLCASASGQTAAQSPPQGVYLKAAAAKHRGLTDASVIDSSCGLAEASSACCEML